MSLGLGTGLRLEFFNFAKGKVSQLCQRQSLSTMLKAKSLNFAESKVSKLCRRQCFLTLPKAMFSNFAEGKVFQLCRRQSFSTLPKAKFLNLCQRKSFLILMKAMCLQTSKPPSHRRRSIKGKASFQKERDPKGYSHCPTHRPTVCGS